MLSKSYFLLFVHCVPRKGVFQVFMHRVVCRMSGSITSDFVMSVVLLQQCLQLLSVVVVHGKGMPL